LISHNGFFIFALSSSAIINYGSGCAQSTLVSETDQQQHDQKMEQPTTPVRIAFGARKIRGFLLLKIKKSLPFKPVVS